MIQTPEVSRVYIGSFWDGPLQNDETAPLLEAEMADLLTDLNSLPSSAAVRKVNELVKRMRLLKAHAHLVDHLRREMPSMFGKDKKKAALLADMPAQFRTVCRTNNLPPGDFPEIAKFKSVVQELDFAEFPKLDGKRMKSGKLMQQLDHALAVTLPELMRQLPRHNPRGAPPTGAEDTGGPGGF